VLGLVCVTFCSNMHVVTKEFSKILSSPEENSFDLDIVGRVSFMRSNLADKIFISCQTCLVTERVIFHKLPFVRYSVYNKYEVSYLPTLSRQNTTKNNRSNSRAQDICAIDNNVFFKWNTFVN